MFCKKCGYQIKEGLLFCPNCGEKAVGGAPNQHIEPKPQGKSLKKCAWYAPVSVFVTFVLSQVIAPIQDIAPILSNTVNFIVIIIISIVFYYVSTRNVKLKIKKRMRKSLLIPMILSAIAVYIMPTIAVGILSLFIGDGRDFFTILEFLFPCLIFLILLSGLSYFITAKYFEKEEKKIISEMLQE